MQGPDAASGADQRTRVAFAGEHGSFAEDAVLAYFQDPDPVPLASFRDVADEVAHGRATPQSCRAGVLPIENLVSGTVREVYDLLLEYPLRIVGEVVVPVRLCLAALPGERLEAIERVYSHGQALAQAERFLRSRPWRLLATYNTAGSGRMIAERGEHAAAAVLSPRGAALFGLEVLEDGIEDVPDNRTRFLVVSPGAFDPRTDPSPREPGRPMRTTLVLGVPNEPGALHRCLGVFAEERLNVSKLESRPSHARDWEYVFWLDLDADTSEPAMARALGRVGLVSTLLKLIGCYPRAREGPPGTSTTTG